MPLDLKSKEKIFRTQGFIGIRSWIRETLECWFMTGEGECYSPFLEFFYLSKEPHEILETIYHSLSTRKRSRDNRSQRGLFRDAVADLIREPGIVLENPKIFREILRLGSVIRSNEVMESLCALVQTNILHSELTVYDDMGEPVVYDFLDEAIDAVRHGQFSTNSTLQFYKAAALRASENCYVSPVLLEGLLQADPQNWYNYTNLLAQPLNSYKRTKLGQPDYDYVVEMLRDVLRKNIAPELYELYKNELRIGQMADNLNWLIYPETDREPIRAEKEKLGIHVRSIGNSLRKIAASEAGKSEQLRKIELSSPETLSKNTRQGVVAEQYPNEYQAG